MLNGLFYFLVIQNFSALITLGVGSTAFFVYALQKRDEKINAARLVLSEVRNAERKILEISELAKNKSKDFPRVLTTNSWRRYSNLFASDFDQDQITEINQFFSICEDVDDYVQRDNSFFWINSKHRAEVVQEKLAEAISSSFDAENTAFNKEKVDAFVDNVLNTFSNHFYTYAPNKTINYLNDFIGKFKPITTTTTGSKLKKLAKDGK